MATATTTFASIVFGYPGASQTSTKTGTAPNTWTTKSPLDTGTLLDYFTEPYFLAHELSWPSFRYAYITWMVIGGIWFLYVLGHIAFRQGGGPVGAVLRKYGSKRLVKGGVVRADAREKNGSVRKRLWVSPTLAQLVAIFVFTAAIFALCYVGPDYLAPTECTWGGVCEAAASARPPATTFYSKRKRDLSALQALHQAEALSNVEIKLVHGTKTIPLVRNHIQQADTVRRALEPRRTGLNPNGYAPYNDPLLSGPNYRIDKNWWTSSSRIGMIAYALMPISVALALKTFPFAAFSIPKVTHVDNFNTAFFHQWLGRVIWLLSTVHVVLWTLQLFQDKDPFGDPVFVDVWDYWRFQAGVAGYIAICAMVILSLKPIRQRHHEWFVWSHRALTVAFLVGCGLHYRYLGPYCFIALALWGTERGFRTLIWLRINGFFNGLGHSEKQSRKLLARRLVLKGPVLAQAQGVNPDSPFSSQPFALSTASLVDDEKQGFEKVPLRSSSPLPPGARKIQVAPIDSLEHLTASSTSLVAKQTAATVIPAGFSLVQLLPGRVIRLTFNPPTDVHWESGQHVSLTIPSVRMCQGHPYTIANADSRITNSANTTMVILLKVRRAFTRRLWEHAVKQRQREASSETNQAHPGILLRTQISLPSGTSADFDRFDTVCIVAGGSGVSFGLAVFEHVCHTMRRAQNGGGGRRGRTTRLRFVWLLKEYSHLAWVASSVAKCLQMVPSDQVQLDFFATSEKVLPMNTAYDDAKLELPRPHYGAGHVRRDSEDSNSAWDDDMSDTKTETVYSQHYQSAKRSPPSSDPTDDLYDIYFEGEDEEGDSYAEQQLSTAVQQEGKIRRAHSRKHRRQDKDKRLASSSDATLADHYPPTLTTTAFEPLEPPRRQFADRRDSSNSLKSLLEASNHTYEAFLKDQRDQNLRLDLSEADLNALDQIAEFTRSGRPNISAIVDEEIGRSAGRILVAGCGPKTLNTKIRALVSKRVSPMKMLQGDQRGDIQCIVEDFE